MTETLRHSDGRIMVAMPAGGTGGGQTSTHHRLATAIEEAEHLAKEALVAAEQAILPEIQSLIQQEAERMEAQRVEAARAREAEAAAAAEAAKAPVPSIDPAPEVAPEPGPEPLHDPSAAFGASATG